MQGEWVLNQGGLIREMTLGPWSEAQDWSYCLKTDWRGYVSNTHVCVSKSLGFGVWRPKRMAKGIIISPFHFQLIQIESKQIPSFSQDKNSPEKMLRRVGGAWTAQLTLKCTSIDSSIFPLSTSLNNFNKNSMHSLNWNKRLKNPKFKNWN